jgi:hypothetical protein
MKQDYDPFLDGFEREVVESFAWRGIYPPPYAANEQNPETVLLLLASQEQRRDPPSLLGTDEEGVEQQMMDFLAMVGLGLKRYDALRDPNEFGSWHR